MNKIEEIIWKQLYVKHSLQDIKIMKQTSIARFIYTK